MEIATRRKLDDKLEWLKFGGLDWDAESKGFFYSRFETPPEGEEFQSLNKNQKVYYHRVGTPQSADILIHEDPEHPDWGFSPTVTEDGKYLILTIWVGTDDRYQIKYLPLGGELSEALQRVILAE